ncbi:MAG: VCBS repeat-containing protein [Bacteroidota bacterium]
MDYETTGIHFKNQISENDSINVVKFQYCYNGGGVGIGDFDKNGLPDILFTGNQVPSELYLNQGKFQFTEISEEAKLYTKGWVTGVSVVDINSDGWEDIYLSVGGADCRDDCPNLLFVNQGNGPNGTPTFREMAKEYGLNDAKYGQQAVFFDYDGDGDLDVFLLRNGNSNIDKNNPIPKKYMPPHLRDALFRNDSIPGKDHPVFTDISDSAGIVHGGFGLGLGINDFNNDHLVDIYVANDFITDDLLYIQKRNADSITPWYQDMSKDYLGHATYNSMGMDFSDLNSDTYPDILVVDMLPEKYERQKKMLGMMNYERYQLSLRNHYQSQYVRNTLQIHNGLLDGKPLKASEVGFAKGITSTDWSWAPLMIDLDNDADKDIYITNGYVKDVTDLDYINYSSIGNKFGSVEERMAKRIESLTLLDSIYLPNYIYENTGDADFMDVSKEWVGATPSYSNGLAYADFDLDGDLDLAINNINEKAFLYENRTSQMGSSHYLRLQLKGTKKNPHGIGSKITVWDNGTVQQHFQSVVRGYLSSVEPIVHFGVKDSIVDSLRIVWPNGKATVLRNLGTDQVMPLAIFAADINKNPVERKTLTFQRSEGVLDYVHKENPFNEYSRQHLLMRQYSQSGPCLAIGNVDGQPGDELFIGGSKGTAGKIWSQNAQGTYRPIQELHSEYEDTDAFFMDFDGDLDLDLFVASGGTEFYVEAPQYQDRLYLNNGKGYFEFTPQDIPEEGSSSHCIRATDFDNDGDIDFFIGSRSVPGRYPEIPKSKLLVNQGGRFTPMALPVLENLGMVTDAIWADVDADGWQDLILVGEWMPITVLKNSEGHLALLETGWTDENDVRIRTEGWWNCLASGDFDNDGDVDFLAGNQGMNGFLKPNQDYPIYVYNKDFDQNGSPDPIMARYYETHTGKKLMPLHSRDDIVAQLVQLKRRYLKYEDFSKVDFPTLLQIEDLESETLQAYTFASSFVENLGDGNFRITPLPMECQVAPINDMLVKDYNKDGKLDLLVVGNDFSSETIYGKQDALNGLLLLGEDEGFEVVKSKDSGFYVPGQSHHLDTFVDRDGQRFIIASQNNGAVVLFSMQEVANFGQ